MDGEAWARAPDEVQSRGLQNRDWQGNKPGEGKAEQPLFIPERGWAMSRARQGAGLEKPRLALGTKWGHHIYAQHSYLPLLVTHPVGVLLS